MPIKKRPGWSTYSPPIQPSPPRKPEPEFEECKFESLDLSESATDDDIVDVPAGASCFRFTVDNSVCYYEGDSPTYCIEWGKQVKTTKPTPKYEALLEKYNNDVARHKQDLIDWREGKKQWKLWVAECARFQAERELARARKLLQEAGELK